MHVFVLIFFVFHFVAVVVVCIIVVLLFERQDVSKCTSSALQFVSIFRYLGIRQISEPPSRRRFLIDVSPWHSVNHNYRVAIERGN